MRTPGTSSLARNRNGRTLPDTTPTPAAQCPVCGYETLHLVADTMICMSTGCGYEHLLTRPIPIIRKEEK
jgi:hypothetical protein